MTQGVDPNQMGGGRTGSEPTGTPISDPSRESSGDTGNSGIEDWAHRAAQAAVTLQELPASARSTGLQLMATALANAQDEILEANTLDLEASQERAAPDLLQDWLKLTPERLQGAIAILRELGEWPDPMQQVSAASYQPERGQAYSQRAPLGIVALLYEAFPELGAIASGLTLRTANVLLLHGGSETRHSSTIVVDVLQEALEKAGLPPDSVLLLPGDRPELVTGPLSCGGLADLIIPYGRPSWVRQVTCQAMGPVLPTAIGNCYLYWGSSASLETVRWMIIDSHRGEPDAVNAIEKVLLPPGVSASSLQMLWNDLQERGFELRADAGLSAEFSSLALAGDDEWGEPYLRRTVAFRTVASPAEAIAWINRHGSGHADCLATDAYGESRLFTLGLRSAMVYVNASPRFQRRPGNGGAIALGMSNAMGNQAGRIGLDTLTQMTQIVLGQKK